MSNWVNKEVCSAGKSQTLAIVPDMRITMTRMDRSVSVLSVGSMLPAIEDSIFNHNGVGMTQATLKIMRRLSRGVYPLIALALLSQGCVHSPSVSVIDSHQNQVQLAQSSTATLRPATTQDTIPTSLFARLSRWFNRKSESPSQKFVATPKASATHDDLVVRIETEVPTRSLNTPNSSTAGPTNSTIRTPAWNQLEMAGRVSPFDHSTAQQFSTQNQVSGRHASIHSTSPDRKTYDRQLETIPTQRSDTQVLPGISGNTLSGNPPEFGTITRASAAMAVDVQRQTTSVVEPALIPAQVHERVLRARSSHQHPLNPMGCGPVNRTSGRSLSARSTSAQTARRMMSDRNGAEVAPAIRTGPHNYVKQASFEDEIQVITPTNQQEPVPEALPESERGLTPPPEPPLPSPPSETSLPTGPLRIPLAGQDLARDIELSMKDGRVTLMTRNAPVQAVLNLLAEQQGLNLVAAEDVVANISVTLTNVEFNDALNAIVAIAGCTWAQNRGIILVSKIGGDSQGGPDVQGKVVQVFPLNFVSAADIEATIRGLLTPVGQVFTTQTSPTDKRKTQELVVVEDLPASVSRVTQYIQQVDVAPRQVMIEAHILQVDLKDDTRHGVDWKFLTTYMGRDLSLKSVGFTNPNASPASIFSMDGAHLDVVLEALKTTTDAKTLADPKVIVTNGQEARIQIGSKLGYFVTTTTQTSTLQNVNFLNTGVLLKVTPQISNDNRVLMNVSPEVSTGRISAAGLPETNTTEATTTVLLENNGGMVIGGLIKENDSDTQDKVPILGDLWGIGRLFQRRSVARQRSEIIIVLIPHIAPYSPNGRMAEQTEILRATTPIFQNGLQPTARPLDPRLPDAINNPRRLRLSRLPDLLNNPIEVPPKPMNHYFPTIDEEFLQPDNQWTGPNLADNPQLLQVEVLPPPAAPPIETLPILEPPQ